MRDHKFRGKRIDNGEWVYGDLLHGSYIQDGSMWIRYFDEKHQCYDSKKVHPETVEEFTGCHDKNGKEVYEGNILSDGVEKWVVKHSETETGFHARNGADHNNIFSLWHLCHRHNNKREVEVVGDIHDDIKV